MCCLILLALPSLSYSLTPPPLIYVLSIFKLSCGVICSEDSWPAIFIYLFIYEIKTFYSQLYRHR